MTQISITNEFISAQFNALGAELTSLRSRSGRELIWHAGEAWPRHAPILFPIVGRLNEDRLQHQHKSYSLKQHGFARDSVFEVIEQSKDMIVFCLRDSAQSQLLFPFPFELVIRYQIIKSSLITTYTVRNNSEKTLPFSIGAHPAFHWPLNNSLSKSDYYIQFSESETSQIRRLNKGLLRAATETIPLLNRQLPLSDSLFKDDAIIFDQLNSHEVRLENRKNDEVINIRFEDFPQLGIWSKPDANFICIEPWQGYASPEEFNGEFSEKPGIVRLSSHSERSWSFTIAIENID